MSLLRRVAASRKDNARRAKASALLNLMNQLGTGDRRIPVHKINNQPGTDA
jgi:hypothetical protein